MHRHLIALAMLGVASIVLAEESSPSDIFQRRVLPILKSPKASSCTECHFGGVELKSFIHEDQATTFAALRRDGLIDIENPDNSKLLQFIGRKPESGNALIAKVRESEYAAFREWIRAAVRDPTLLGAKGTSERVGIELPPEVIRHARRDRVTQSFVENIWSEMGRCIHCHSPEKNQRQVEKHGPRMSWIKPGDPFATLRYLVDEGLVDTDAPEDSMIRTKPTVLIEHGGGPKFAVGSRTDRQFLAFLRDFAALSNEKYKAATDLPKPSSNVTFLTEQHLRITNLPERLGSKLLRVAIFRKHGDGWSTAACAVADNPINGKQGIWQSMILAIAPRDSQQAELLRKESKLPAGEYLVKIYVDFEDRLPKDESYELGPAEFLGEVQIHGPWQPGYQPPKIIQAPTRRTD